MTTLVLEDVDEAVVERLRILALAANRSLEQQARAVLEGAVPPAVRLNRAEIAAAIAALTPTDVLQTDAVVLLREDRARDDFDAPGI